MPLIRWTILMSSGSRTRDDETLRPFRTYAGTPDGSWTAKTRGPVTCQSGFLGSTGMSRLFPDLQQTLGLLRKGTWIWPSWSLLYMSSAIKRGVIWFRITSRGLILGGTWDSSVEYHILLWTPRVHSWLHNWCPSCHVPPYEEVIVEQQWAIHPPDPYQIISNIRARLDSAMRHPDVFRNPEEVLRLIQGIQSEWTTLKQMSALRRRSRSPRE